ncbi:phage scaffolding protein [Paenibacillus polymyxa]|uniref:phage scaffolding protein n=1 Tax=Paenibacillus polymyxa TaxID=1406 RepID=UPI0021E3AB05|nr:phage scaffolding protein [Paenibacillus polymyxa]MEE4577855.1 phage scaffolding protein [Paenibacillus polymyxa]
MNKEQFVALGLTEELATKAAEASAEELKGFVPKTRFDEVNEAKKQAEKDRDSVGGQLEELKKSAGASEELKTQIEKLQGENKATKDQYEAKLKEMSLNTALKLALNGQTHDPDIVASLIDKTRIELDDNGAVKGGLDDQLTGLRESKGFLFVPKEEGNTQPTFKGAKPAEGAGAGNPPAPLKGYDAGKSIAEQRNGSEK